MRSDWSDLAFDLQKSNQHSLKQTLLSCGGAQSRLKGLPMCLWRSNLFYWSMRYKIFFSFKMLHLFPVFHQNFLHFCLALLCFFVFRFVFLYVAAKFSSFYKTTSLEYLMKKHLRAYGQNASLMQSSKDSIFFSQNCSNSPSLIFHLTRAVRGAGAYPSSQ